MKPSGQATAVRGLPFFLAVILAGCGYVGDPLPPLANVPGRITDLSAVQRSSQIIVHFTLPQQTTEGVAIRQPLELDLRVGTPGSGWAARARHIPGGAVENGHATFAFPSTDWTGKEVTIAARAIGANHKESDWSNYVNLAVVAPPEKPAAVKAQAAPEGVHLSWEGPAGTFRIFRRGPAEKNFSAVADVDQLQWTDTNAEFGEHYTYRVQRIVKTGDNQIAESDPSEEAGITPIDVFPPAAPGGLRAAAAPSSVELSWDRNTEPDLAGYRVYRGVGGGQLEKIAEVSQIPAYSDGNIEHGRTYRYAVTAIDRAGNESGKSAVVEVTP